MMFMWRYLILLLLIPLIFAKRVESSAMGDTLKPGDLIWILPLTPKAGDLVVFTDPLNHNRTLIRRVIATEKESFLYDKNGTPIINGKALKQSELSTTKERVIVQESLWINFNSEPQQINWRTIRNPKGYQSSKNKEIQLSADEIFLLADDRDQQLDSRWWGPLKRSEINGVVKIRFGKASLWRSWLEYYD